MVKLGRGGRRHLGGGRPEPLPLFPPGELPVFGPPPVNMRRGPPGPPRRGGYGGPPRPPPPPHMRPPGLRGPPPPNFPPMQRRPPPMPPVLRPLLQTPILPPRGLPFMRGARPMPRGRGRGPPLKRLGKNMKKMKNKRNKAKDAQKVDGEFYCEVCDRGWETEEELNEHLEGHISCEIDGCSFSGHPKIVALHVKLQHSTGLFQKIPKSKDQEEIKKWIEERKRKYPTKENVERKVAEKCEMDDRGERLQEEGPRFKNNPRLGKRQATAGRSKPRRKRTKPNYNQPTITEEESFDIPPFPGTSQFLSDEETNSVEEGEINDKFEDDEWHENHSEDRQQENKNKTAELNVSSALMNLMSSYCSGDSENEDESVEKNIVPEKTTAVTNNAEIDSTNKPLPIQNDNQDDDGPEEINGKMEPDATPNIYTEMAVEKGVSRNESHKKIFKHNKQNGQPKNKNLPRPKPTPNRPIHPKQLTLLQELLKDEIRHERNVILQCVRFIVKNNFFDKNAIIDTTQPLLGNNELMTHC